MEKILGNKKKISAVALVLLMASVMLTLYLPAQAQDEPTNVQDNYSIPLPAGVTPDERYPTIAHMSYRPNPIGVGQSLLVNLWMQPPLHVTRGFSDYKVTITDPDGNVDTITVDSYLGDATAWFEYVFDQVGTWKLKFDFPGAYFPAGNYSTPGSFRYGSYTEFTASVYYEPSSDGPYDLVVQEELVLSWPPASLPTDYWTRPVSSELREWGPILGNYPPDGIVGGGPDWPAETNPYMSNYDFIPYVQGPKSPHVVWKRQDDVAGIIGGSTGILHYTNRGNTPSMIFQGRCYDTVTKIVDGELQGVWQCYDLRTGEVYWELLGTSQRPNMISYIERTVETVPGEEASKSGMTIDLIYVGGGRLIKYDPWDGRVALDVSIAPLSSGTFYADPFFLTVQNLGGGVRRLINWTVEPEIWFPAGTNWHLEVYNNISWPFSSLGTVDYEAGVAIETFDIQTPATGGIGTGFDVEYAERLVAASLKTGQVLWNITTDVSKGVEGVFSGSSEVVDHGKFAVRLNDGHYHCWDALTGQKLWKSELTSWPWGTFGNYGSTSYGGMLIEFQYDCVVAYDWDDGKIVWTYNAPTDYEFETPYYDEDHIGVYPWFTGTCRIADGVLYVGNAEHSAGQPAMRGMGLHAINVTSGEGMWKAIGDLSPGPVADGYLTAGNAYDGYMYVFGKGKSATTVTAPKTEIPLGQSVVIEGTVLDMSPAQPGTPCVSKDSMTDWMAYLHLQRPIPADVTGVPVSLDTIDPNGNYVHIGDATTDMTGTFGYMWAPEVPGTYQVYATFLGDDSYGSSVASTYVGVGEAPEPPPEYGTPEWPAYPEPEKPADYTSMFLAVIAGIVVVAILVVYDIFGRRRQ